MKKNVFVFTSSFLSLTVLEYIIKNKEFVLKGVCFHNDFFKKKNNIKQKIKNFLGGLKFNLSDNFFYYDPYAHEKKRILKYMQSIKHFFWKDSEKERLKKFMKINELDIIIVAGFKFINESFYSLSQEYSINIHPGILPENKGSSPVQWSIYRGESQTGITIHKLEKKMDSGEIFLLKKFKVPKNINFYELEKKINQKIPTVLHNLFTKKTNNNILNDASIKMRSNFNRSKSFLDLSENFYSLECNLRAMKPVTGLKYLYNGKMICVWEIVKIKNKKTSETEIMKAQELDRNLILTCRDCHFKVTKVLSFGKVMPFSNLKL